jgi:hypothetical protein
MGTYGPLPYSQHPAIGPFHQSLQFSQRPHNLTPCFNINPHLLLGLTCGLLHSRFLIEILHELLTSPVWIVLKGLMQTKYVIPLSYSWWFDWILKTCVVYRTTPFVIVHVCKRNKTLRICSRAYKEIKRRTCEKSFNMAGVGSTIIEAGDDISLALATPILKYSCCLQNTFPFLSF